MLQILEAGFLTTIQDAGRQGYERYGVPVSGAMDWFALRAANALAGNPPEEAALELAAQGISLLAGEDCLLALAGRGFALEVDGRRLPAWMAVFVRRGWRVRVTASSEGAGWGYLAVAGGLSLPRVMGSRATYLRGGFGGFLGRALQAGDILLHGAAPDASLLIARAGKDLRPPDFYTRTAGETVTLEVIPGVQAEMFTARGLETFYTCEYTVSALSDRMGYRLEGEAIEHRAAADILSEGVVFGAVQVPASGKPLVLMADRQTAGGYAKIAAVVTADLPALAQQPLGTGRVRFRETTVEQAQARLKEMAGILDR